MGEAEGHQAPQEEALSRTLAQIHTKVPLYVWCALATKSRQLVALTSYLNLETLLPLSFALGQQC